MWVIGDIIVGLPHIFFDGTPPMDVDEMYYQASATDWRLKPANQQLNNLFRANAH